MIVNFGIASIFFWLVYILTMKMLSGERDFKKMSVIKKLVAGVALGIDVVYNYTYGTLLFLDFPIGKYTFTARLKDYVKTQPTSWRGKLSDFICRTMVSPYDYDHCGLGYGK